VEARFPVGGTLSKQLFITPERFFILANKPPGLRKSALGWEVMEFPAEDFPTHILPIGKRID
jgi:hypothetical protein